MQNTPVNFILHWYEYKNTSNWPRFDIPYDDGLYNSKLISLLIICVFIFIVWFICLLFQLLYFFLFCIVSLTRKRRRRALDWFYLIWLICKLTKIHLPILFCTGINTKTRPTDTNLTIRVMMDCVIRKNNIKYLRDSYIVLWF